MLTMMLETHEIETICSCIDFFIYDFETDTIKLIKERALLKKFRKFLIASEFNDSTAGS